MHGIEQYANAVLGELFFDIVDVAWLRKCMVPSCVFR